GLGVALQSRAAVELELGLGLLATIRPRGGLPHRSWYVVRATTGPVRDVVDAFMAYTESPAARQALARARDAGAERAASAGAARGRAPPLRPGRPAPPRRSNGTADRPTAGSPPDAPRRAPRSFGSPARAPCGPRGAGGGPHRRAVCAQLGGSRDAVDESHDMR